MRGRRHPFTKAWDYPVIWIEADPRTFVRLQHNIKDRPGQLCIEALLGDQSRSEVKFYVANNQGMSSSTARMKLHRRAWPDVSHIEEIKLPCRTLPDVLTEHFVDLSKYDLIALDVQCDELRVLEGSLPIIHNFKWIILPAADYEAYEERPVRKEIEQRLREFGYRRIAIRRTARKSVGSTWELLFRRCPWRLYHRFKIIVHNPVWVTNHATFAAWCKIIRVN